MQSIMPINLQTLISEASSVQSSEQIDESAANAFRTQIGQILGQNDENGSDPSEKKSTEDVATEPSNHPLRMRFGVSTPSGRSIKSRVIADLNGPDSMSPELPNGDDAGDRTEAINSANDSVPGSRLPDAAIREAMPGTRSVPGNEWGQNLQNAADPSVTYPPDISDSNANGPRKPQFMKEAGRNSPIIPAMRQAPPLRSETKIEEKNFSFTDNLQLMQDSDSSAPQNILNGDQLNTISQALVLESSNESFLQSESTDTPEKMNLAGFELSVKDNTKIDISPNADSPQEAQNNAHTPFEEMNPQGKGKGTLPDAFVSQTRLTELSKESVLQSESSVATLRIDLAEKLEILQNTATPLESAPTDVPISKTQNNVDGSLEEKNPQSLQDSTRPVPLVSQAGFPESSKGAILQSESGVATLRIDLAEELEILQNADAPLGNERAAVPISKMQNNVYGSLEEKNPQSLQGSIRPVPLVSQTGFSESKGAILQSESGVATLRIDLAEELEILQNADAPLGNERTAVPISKMQNNAYGSLEEKNPQSLQDSTRPVPLVSQARFPESSKGAILQSESSVTSPRIDSAEKLEIPQNADARLENAPKVVPNTKTQNGFYGSLEGKNPQSLQDSTRPVPLVSQTRFLESSKGAILQSESSVASPRIDLAEKFEILRDVDAQWENATTAVPNSKTQNNVYGSLEGKNLQNQLDSTQPVPSVSQARFPESSKGTIPQSESKVASLMSDSAEKLEIPRNADARLENALKIVPNSKTQNGFYGSPEGKNPQIQPDSARPVPLVSQARFPEFSIGAILQSESSVASQRIDLAEKLEIPQNTNTRIEDSLTDISVSKAQDAVEAAPESMGFDECRADQDISHNAPIHGIAAQSKPENTLQNSGKIPTTAAENPQEAFSAFLPPIAVRVGDSGSFIGAASELVPTAQPKEFILQIAQRIQFQIREGKETIRIQLKPDSLGRIEIRAETTGNGVIARIATESNNVKSYLENNMHMLQQTLQDQGLKVDRIYIVVHDGLDFSTNSGYGAQFGHAGSGHSSSESQRYHGISGSMTGDPLEEIPLDATTWVSLNPNIRFHTIA
jgi:flagellar hook-length control protein FliK